MNRGVKITLAVLMILTLGVGGYYAYDYYSDYYSDSGSTPSAKKNRKLVYTRN